MAVFQYNTVFSGSPGAAAGFWTMWESGPYCVCVVVTLLMQTVFCVLAYSLQTDKLDDLAETGNMVVVAVLSLWVGQVYEPRQLMVVAFVCVWGVRLVAYVVTRAFKVGQDERFDAVHGSFPKFVAYWVFQAVWVLVVMLQVLVLNSPDASTTRGRPEVMTPRDWTGAAMFVLGLTVEVLADQQKFRFRGDASKKGKFCNTGLWRYSRHPNYFGEILLWWGVFVVVSNVLSGLAWLTLVSPLFVTHVLLFVSGMPPLEHLSDKKYGHLPQYRTYKQTTSPLVPLPPAVYKVLPQFVRLVLCEFPMLSRRQQTRG